MDLDLGFLSAVLRQDGGYFAAKRGGVVTKMLEGPAVTGWEFVEAHVLEFGAVPTEDFFSAKTGIDLQDVTEDVAVLVGDLKDRALWNKLKSTHEKMGVHLEAREPKQALSVVQSAVHESYKDDIAGGNVGSLLAHGDEVLEFYERMKKGERGVLSPWKAMNDMTLGWWGGDLVVFVARMGVGKTFAMLLLAREAWLGGAKVLFVGTEMSRMKLALRFYSLHLHLPYKELKRGQLSTPQEEKMRQAIRDMSSEQGLDVVGDDFDAQIGEIESAVEQTRPDILFVDGLYLVKNEGKNRHERVSETADDLKRLARRRNIPVVASTQFNRDVANNSRSAVSAGNIGITDVIGWDSDVIFGMYQTDDMKDDSVMGFRPLKLREGEGQDFFSKWDFETMQFPQEDVDVDGEFQDGDYGTVPGVAVDGDDGWTDDGDSLF
jgi:replicative DNA helicase